MGAGGAPRGGPAPGRGGPPGGGMAPRGGAPPGRGAPPGGGGGGGAPRGGPAPARGGAPPARGAPPGRGGGAAAAPRLPTATALWDFAADNDDELSFNAGSVLSIIAQSDPDWWDAELNGKKGVVPANYLKMD